MKKIFILMICIIFLLNLASAVTWDNGAYWKMENASLVDEVNGNDGTNDGISFVAGLIDNAGDFEVTETDAGIFTNISGWANESDGSISLWLKPETFTTTAQFPFYHQGAVDDRLYLELDSNLAGLRFGWMNKFPTYNTTWGDGSWRHVVVRWNNSGGVDLWVNGTKRDTETGATILPWNDEDFLMGAGNGVTDRNYDGLIDEVGVWKRWITDAEIGSLYNSGSGLAYGTGGFTTISSNLTAPANNTLSSASNVYFNATYNISTNDYNWTNATYWIWYSNGTILNNSHTEEIIGTDNSTQVQFGGFGLGNYIWNVYACYTNATGDYCNWSDNGNFSFGIGAQLVDQNYSNFVFETQYRNFTANISLLPGATIYDQRLWYDGVAYAGNLKSVSGDDYILWKAMDIPLISSVSQNKSFFWGITFERDDGSFFFQNLTAASLNVTNITFSLCSSGDKALNFTTWDEENSDTRLIPYDFFGTFNYWLGSGEVYRNYSTTNTNINESVFCISEGDLTFYSDAQVQYEKTSYVKRSYYLSNASLTNTTDHIKLFLLNSSLSTSFIIDVIDENKFSVPGVLISIQRYYPGKGTFETTEMGMTDSQGSTIGHFEAETEDYKIIIYNDTDILFTSGIQKVFCRDTPCTLTFTTGSVNTTQWSYFGNITGLIWSLEFNETNNLWYYTYVDTTGSFNFGRMYVYKETGLGKTTICNVNSSSSAATLTCNVTGNDGKSFAIAYIGDPEQFVYLKSAVVSAAKSVFGLEGLFWAFIILLVLACAGLWNPAVGAVLVVVGMIVLNITGLATFGAVTIWGVIFLLAILLWELKT